MKKIKLTRGKYAIVDDEDYGSLSKFKWCAHQPTKSREIYYASRRYRLEKGHYPFVLMHRQIMNPPKGYVVDHINGDSLDNRRVNLRIVTQRENTLNQKKHREGKTFGFYKSKKN